MLSVRWTSACMPVYYCRFKLRKCFHLLSDGGEKHGFAASGETGANGLAFLYKRNAQGLRGPERKGCLTPVDLD